MPSPIQHPILGTLVPDQWNDSLMTFRQFPHLRPFWIRNRDRAFSHLSPEHRRWVDNWTEHIVDLALVCRNSEVQAALQSLGVYEIEVGSRPSDTQVAAYCYFIDNEQQICQNVCEALTRYYRLLLRESPDWFEGEDYPDSPAINELGEIISFDGFSIVPHSSHGLSPLRFGWDPSWDPEHGLLMAVYRDQVIAIGADDVDELLESAEEFDGYYWGRQQMTQQEQTALDRFRAGFEACDNED